MDEKFNPVAELFPDQAGQNVNLIMRFMDIQVPGQGQMAVNVQQRTVFDDS